MEDPAKREKQIKIFRGLKQTRAVVQSLGLLEEFMRIVEDATTMVPRKKKEKKKSGQYANKCQEVQAVFIM